MRCSAEHSGALEHGATVQRAAADSWIQVAESVQVRPASSEVLAQAVSGVVEEL